MKKMFVLFISILGLFAACEKEDDMPAGGEDNFSNGILVVNEGPFQTGSGTITYLDRDSGLVIQKLYQQQNPNSVLGNIAQSIYIHGGLAYIVVNNAHKIEVVDAHTFKYQATIEGFELPRYFLPLGNNKAYVSQWGADGLSGSVAIVDLDQNQIINTLPCGHGPEALLLHQSKIYVANQGGFGNDSTVVVIDPNSDTIVDRLVTGENPHSLVEDKDGQLWVLSRGFSDYLPNGIRREGRLSQIVDGQITFSTAVSQDAKNLVYDPAVHQFFYTAPEGIYQFDGNQLSEPKPVIPNRLFYGLGFNPKEGLLYAADARQFQSAGIVLIYESNGSPIDSFETGIIPNSFWFP